MEKDINFQNAIKHLFKLEGGYSNNKYDKGGETNYGITQKTYSLYLKKQNFQNKTVKENHTNDTHSGAYIICVIFLTLF